MSGDANASSLSPDRAVAIFLLSIDAELAASVLRGFSDDNLDRVTRAMRELQEVSVHGELISAVYQEVVMRMRDGGMALGDVWSTMDKMLIRAFGETKGADVSRRASNEILVRKPFAVFESLPAEDLAGLLVEEHPQIAAVFLAHLDRLKAGHVLKHLPEESRPDIVQRVATLDRVSPEVVQRVLEVMRHKVKDLGLTALRSEPKARIKAAAEILNNMGGGEKAVLEAVAESDETVAEGIRDEMFTFDDLSKLDKKSMQKVLSQVDSRVLALALKAVTPEVENNIFSNLSNRAADMVKEERDTLGPTPLSEVVEAQQQVLGVIRDLMDKGEVTATVGQEKLV
ncbi:MAG: flagellar motor switch protein FliG [Planctomycetota bacterium]